MLGKLFDSRVIPALSIELLVEKFLDFFVLLVDLDLCYFDLVSQTAVLSSEFDQLFTFLLTRWELLLGARDVRFYSFAVFEPCDLLLKHRNELVVIFCLFDEYLHF